MNKGILLDFCQSSGKDAAYVKGADCSAPLCKTFEAPRRYRMLARWARDCLDSSHISSSRERRSSMSAA